MKGIVVEDQQVARAKLASMIERMGHEVLQAEDSEQGVALWRKKKPDLVLMDAIMPVLAGYAAARCIRALEPGDWTPIMFLSAAEADQDLVKPVSFVVLHAKIRAMQRIDDMRRRITEMTERLAEANQELARLSNQDGLTALANRRCFDDALRREARDARFCAPGREKWRRATAARSSRSSCRRTTRRRRRRGASSCARPSSRCGCRTGPARRPLWVTVSVGSATLHPAEDDGASLIAAADWALYRAKRSGRKQVVASRPE